MANPEDLGRYRLKRLLGRGALGEVWEARDLEQEGAKVVVKIMHAADDELALARSHFAREARLASLLRHPHVVEVHDAGEAAGTSFMVMEMVEGTSLRKVLRDPATTLEEKLRWLRQIGDAISAMHGAGIVHRDLKPENVIVRPDRTACVVDLGIAKWTKFDLGGERDPVDVFEGDTEKPPLKTDYAPPEAIEHELFDELGDQYAWGVLAYEVLTGALPDDDAPPLAERKDVPQNIAAAIERARSKSRESRWEGMEALLDEIVDPTDPPDEVAAESHARASGRPRSGRPSTGRGSGGPAGPGAADETAGKKPSVALAGGAIAVVLLVVVGLVLAALR
jgi:serine/threonine-protein kinase